VPFVSRYCPYKVSRFSCAKYSQNVSWDLLSCDWSKSPSPIYSLCCNWFTWPSPVCSLCLVGSSDLRLYVPCALWLVHYTFTCMFPMLWLANLAPTFILPVHWLTLDFHQYVSCNEIGSSHLLSPVIGPLDLHLYIPVLWLVH